ncbi:MAG TPA: hypothetical protein DE179_03325 [Oceanospirillaceae bacterium]|nr:hypothetical protein [Oceanospirillaceae bacterium]
MPIQILIVDNDALSREVLKAWLDDVDYIVDETDSGELALKMTASQHYDVVFMNMRISDVGSPEVAHRIRIQEYNSQLESTTKIIAVCDRYPKSKRYNWQHSGFDGSIGKPIQEKDIMRALDV